MFAFLLAQTIAASSSFSGWWYIGDMRTKSERSIIYASLETRQVENDVARIWIWVVDDRLSESGLESIKSLWENRCASGQQRLVMNIGYDQTGQSIGSVDSTIRPSTWNYVVPDSNGSKILKVACEGRSDGMLPILKSQGTPVEVARRIFQGE